MPDVVEAFSATENVPPRNVSMSERDTPYKGLMPYDVEDAPFFFGRDKWRDIIIDNLMATRLTILYGSSGVGKSSVLRAGVAYHLRKLAQQNLTEEKTPKLAVIVFNSWRDNPVTALLRQIEKEIQDLYDGRKIEPVPTSLSLEQALRAWTERMAWTDSLTGDKHRGELFVILDQFEDYFLYHPYEEGEGAFAVEFPRAVNAPDLTVKFLISLRDDALAKLDRFKDRIPLSNRLCIEHLDEESAAEAIRKPLEAYNEYCLSASEEPITIEDELVGEVLQQVRTGRVRFGQVAGVGEVKIEHRTEQVEPVTIETPFLQLVLERLWAEEMKEKSHTLHLRTLQRLEGAQGIVRTHLQGVMDHLAPSEQEVSARFFNRLVTPSGAKVACRLDDLTKWAEDLAAHVPRVVSVLSEKRIWRTIPAPFVEPQYEIFHDVLAPAILEWRAQYLQAQVRREAERRAQEEAERQRAELELKAAHQRAKLEAKGRKRLQWFVVLLVVLTVVTVVAGLWAKQQQTNAEQQRMASDSLRSIQNQFDLAMLLGVEACRAQDRQHWVLRKFIDLVMLLGVEVYRTDAAQTARDSLLTALTSNPHLVRFLPCDVEGACTVTSNVAAFKNLATNTLTLAWGVKKGDQKEIRVWDISSGDNTPKERPFLNTDKKDVKSLAFSPDGKTLVSGSEDGAVCLWDIESRDKNCSDPLGDGKEVWSVAFSPDGEALASGSADGTICVRNPPGKPLCWSTAKDLKNDVPKDVLSVAFSPDGTTLASGNADYKIRLWDIRGNLLGAPLTGHKNEVRSVAFSSDGKTLASGSVDGTVRLWDATKRQLLSELPGHSDPVLSVAFNPDGKTLAWSSVDGTIRLWDVINQKLLGEPLIGNKSYAVNSVTFPEATTIVSASRGNNSIVLWSLDSYLHLSTVLKETTTGKWSAPSVAFSPDGATLASGGCRKTYKTQPEAPCIEGELRLWDATNGQPRGEPLQGHRDEVLSVAFSPNGKTLVSGSADHNICLWDITNEHPACKPLKGHEDAVLSVAFSPEGMTLASGGCRKRDKTQPKAPCIEGELRLWDATNGQLRGEPLQGHRDEVLSVAFSSDSKILASGSADKTIRLWDVATQQPSGEPLISHTGEVLSVAFSPDGKTLVSGSADKTIRLWDVDAQQPRGEPLRSHGSAVLSVAFSPDGKTLASGSADRTLRLWDVATGQPRGEPLTLDNVVASVAFRPDSKDAKLASGSWDGTVRLWDFSVDNLLKTACTIASRNLTCDEWKLYMGDQTYHSTCPELPSPECQP